MMEIWRGARAVTPAYQRYAVSMEIATRLATGTAMDFHLDSEIRTRHSLLTFQQPDRIAEAVRLFSPIELWNEVGSSILENHRDIRDQLRIIVDRRNKIAHEADVDPSYPGQRWPIERQDTEDALAFVEKIGEAIFALVA
jgi:hypothetical protein